MTYGFIQNYGCSFSIIHDKRKKSRTKVNLMRKKYICANSERLEFKMDKENFFADENESEDEDDVMPALPDSDIDEMDNELINMNSKYESEEYR